METENMKPDFLKQRILIPCQFLKMMALIIIGFSIYSCATLNSTSYQARIRAVNKIADQNILFNVAMEDANYEVRIAAFNKITDQNLINKLAIKSKDPEIRLKSVKILTDQDILYKIALGYIIDIPLTNKERYDIQIAAINKINDQNILYSISKIFLNTPHLEQLKDIDNKIKVNLLNRLTPSQLENLVKENIVLEQKFYVIDFLNDQIILMNISQNNDNWDVRKAAFKKLNDNSLDILTREAKDPALALSAKIRLGRISWNEAFSGKDISLNYVVGAAAIIDTPKPTSYSVISACHKFIQLGDASRIPELIYLLNTFGDVSLAEDYMNCGESTLEDAGCKWGRAHGYTCTTGNGSNRVRWGSKK
ncbi:MAG TPA: hypothetical protein VIK55_03925 [Paludibacter sp.]